MKTITEALKKILPAESVNEVAQAVESMMAEQVKGLENEFQTKLEEAYSQLAEEKQADEAIAEQGYQQAYECVAALMGRLDEQRQEFETALEEGFEEAWNELNSEKGKNGNIEVELYEEFDKKLKEMQEYMVDKMDEFLALQETEIYESAKKDILSDPHVMEQRVAVEKMASILADYMDRDDLDGITSKQLEETHKNLEGLKGQLRIVEARNVKLSARNNKLNEQVGQADALLTEAAQAGKKAERKERARKVKNASGRGQRVSADQLIAEYAAPVNEGSNEDETLVEGTDPLNDLLVLSGIEEPR